jgi:hypothetical protein
VKRVEIEIDGVVAQAELNEAAAPRATAALWDALPIEARLEHAKWSGRACGFRLPALAAAGELELRCARYIRAPSSPAPTGARC